MGDVDKIERGGGREREIEREIERERGDKTIKKEWREKL